MAIHQCPVCGDPGWSPLPFRSRQEIGDFTIAHCERCEHRFLPEPPSDETLESYYDAVYAGDERQDRPARPAWRDRPLARTIVPHLPARADLLEIGSNFGHTLLAFPAGYTLTGVELSRSAAEAAARDPRLKILRGFFERVELPAGAYDAILALAVIEHVRDPLSFLGKAASLLRPGGLLVLMTGDHGSWYARTSGEGWPLYHSAGHLHFFAQRSLAHALERSGLVPERWLWAGPSPVSRRLPRPLGRLLHCQTTSLLFPWLQARRRFGDAMYSWARRRGPSDSLTPVPGP